MVPCYDIQTWLLYDWERERLKGKFTGEFVTHGKCNSKQPDWPKKLCGTKMTSQSHSQHNTNSKTYLRGFFCFVWYGFYPHVHWGLIHCGWSCAVSLFLRIVYPKSRGFQKGGRQRTKPHRPQTGSLRFSLSVSHHLSLFPVEQEHGGGIHMDQRINGTCSVIHSFFSAQMFTKLNLPSHNSLVLLFLLIPVLHFSFCCSYAH